MLIPVGLAICKKLVKCTNVNISTNAFRQPMYDLNFFNLMDYKYGDSLNEHIDLEEYCPLTVGLYTIQLYLKYQIGGKEQMIQSDFYNFEVPFEPRNSIWRNCKN